MSKHICTECKKKYECGCGNPCGYENEKNYCEKCRYK